MLSSRRQDFQFCRWKKAHGQVFQWTVDLCVLNNATRLEILVPRVFPNSHTVSNTPYTAKSTMDLALDEIKPGLTRKSDYTSTEQIDLFNRAGGFDAVKREAKKRKLLWKLSLKLV